MGGSRSRGGMRRPDNGRPDYPYMPLWVDHWLTSARLEHAPPLVELGVFRLLLRAWKQNPPCTVPDDDDLLALMSRLHGHWIELGPQVRAFFPPAPGMTGRLRNPFQWSVYSEAVAAHERRAAAGRKGGRPRKHDDGSDTVPSNVETGPKSLNDNDAKAMLKHRDGDGEGDGEGKPSRSSSIVVGEGGRIHLSQRFASALAGYADLQAWATTTLPRAELLRKVLNNVGRSKGRDAVGAYVATANIALQGNTAGVKLDHDQLENTLRDFLVEPGGYELRYFRRMIACAVPRPGERANPTSRKLTLGEKMFLKITSNA